MMDKTVYEGGSRNETTYSRGDAKRCRQGRCFLPGLRRLGNGAQLNILSVFVGKMLLKNNFMSVFF
ncbi:MULTISPECIES: hypothetical protein [unclassified Akkermansia]|uniref:hypothetical protein n=1 Tax=unclassified Akkermansia TaxID=2608915 RepID=UPI0025C62DFE|nr:MULTISPECIES: hypothetical protein [unclassified Akkermansia]